MAGSAEVPTSRCLSQGFFTVNWHKHALKQKHHVYIKETYIYISIYMLFFPTFHHIHLSQSHTHTHTLHTHTQHLKTHQNHHGISWAWPCRKRHTIFCEIVKHHSIQFFLSLSACLYFSVSLLQRQLSSCQVPSLVKLGISLLMQGLSQPCPTGSEVHRHWAQIRKQEPRWQHYAQCVGSITAL